MVGASLEVCRASALLFRMTNYVMFFFIKDATFNLSTMTYFHVCCKTKLIYSEILNLKKVI